MDLSSLLGLKGTEERVVVHELTAAYWADGGVAVFSTPAMIGLMEVASAKAVHGHLPEGTNTVGVEVNIRHLAATPIGMKVRATGELIEVNNNRLVFKVEAYDEEKKIGEGTHTRYLIDQTRFMKGKN